MFSLFFSADKKQRIQRKQRSSTKSLCFLPPHPRAEASEIESEAPIIRFVWWCGHTVCPLKMIVGLLGINAYPTILADNPREGTTKQNARSEYHASEFTYGASVLNGVATKIIIWNENECHEKSSNCTLIVRFYLISHQIDCFSWYL